MQQLTKKAIMEAFIQLLNVGSLDKIKVKDIVEECGINRNTFYYHFEDIPSLVEDLLRLETEKVLLAEDDLENWEEAFIRAANFALENRKAVFHMYNSSSRDMVRRYLNAVAQDVMARYIERAGAGISAQEEDKELIIRVYRRTLVGMIEDWMEAGMGYDPEELIRRLGVLFAGNIRASLQRSADSA